MSQFAAQIVLFVMEQLSWPLDAQSEACGVNRSTLSRWSRQEVEPSRSSLSVYLQWLASQYPVRQFACSGSWSMPEDRELSTDWRVMLLAGPTRWMLVYCLRGELVAVERGGIPRDCTSSRLFAALAHRSQMRAAQLLLDLEEAEASSAVREVDFSRLAV